tara:strand:+ start:872 stop:1288 length:417 start_codon:yes stop_codon:yes gene_type:complete
MPRNSLIEEEIEEFRNYASSFVTPTIQKEIRGGREAAVASVNKEDYASREKIAGLSARGELNVHKMDFNSRKGIKSSDLTRIRRVIKNDFESKKNIKDSKSLTLKTVNKTDFESKKKHKNGIKRPDGTYSYEEDLFKH